MVSNCFCNFFDEEFKKRTKREAYVSFESEPKKLVEDGKIYLDGTLREYEKEELLFFKNEIIQDYESEFGLDIVFVLNALKKDTIYKKNKKGIYKCHKLSLKVYKGEWCLFIKTNHYVLLRDYGRTWALTREELKNEIN